MHTCFNNLLLNYVQTVETLQNYLHLSHNLSHFVKLLLIQFSLTIIYENLHESFIFVVLYYIRVIFIHFESDFTFWVSYGAVHRGVP